MPPLKFSVFFLLLSIYSTSSFVTPDAKRDSSWMHHRGDERLEIITKPPHPDELEDFWYSDAQKILTSKLSQRMFQPIEKKAKNIIFFLGDGMGVSTVTAARIHKGQKEESDKGGEEAQLYMDSFPVLGTSRTFCSDKTVPDSACTATAYLCGTKANYQTMGLTPNVKLRDCEGQMKPENHVSSILEWSQRAGKSTGIVTKAEINDASPGANYCHIARRYWKNDKEIALDGHDPEFCSDIAEQLILDKPGRDINVILGGGRKHFRNGTEIDFEENIPYERTDGKDLVQTWKDMKNSPKAKYVENRDDFMQVDTADTEYLFGLFAYRDMEYFDDAPAAGDPNLSEMTKKSIEILSKNPNGFYLFVEGARIDHASHDNNGYKAVTETLEFDAAIQLADEMTDDEDTLIIVTADHSHPLTLGGYPYRGNNLLEPTHERLDMDDLPYAMLAYANGPGYEYPQQHGTRCLRYNITEDDFHNKEYQQRPHVPLGSASHAGEDVFIFSKGPFAHLLSGTNQQSYIPHVLGYAACVGPFEHFCDEH